MYCEPNFFDDKKHCKPKPDCKPDYSPLPPFHDKPDMPLPPCGYIFPPVKPYCPGVSPEEQMGILTERVNELINTINEYSSDVYGAYNAIVNSALCNDAYYNEITTEEGYIAEASAKYKVIHIPFLDRAKEPIYFELGLAYNNTTNANVHEDVFNASQRTIADKLIPAYNSDNTWMGAVVWKGAPIGNIGELPAKYTFGVTDNGFFKVYENLTDYTQLKQDCVRNAFEARSVLIQGGNLTPDKFEPDEKNQQLGRVAVGMNYDTKERFIVIVQGSNQSGCTTEQLANIFKTYDCNMAVELSNGMMTTALDKGAFMFVPPTADGVSVPTIPEVNAFWYITKRRHYHNEYVRDVANLTQKYGEMLYRTETANISVDNVKAVVAGFQRALETETTERKAADETLQANIDAEAEAREQGDTTLQQNINTLSQHVDEVEQELKQADATLQRNIDNLRTELTAKDIASVEKTADGTKNIYRIRLNDTNYVDVAIETYDYSMLTQKLDTLSDLEPRLEAEVTARQTADARIEAKADANAADIANLKTEKVNKAGDTMTGDLDMQQHTVTNVKDPVSDTDVVTLGYFNDNKGDTSGKYLPTAGGTMGGNIDMTGNKIVNVPNPSGNTDVSNKQYVDNQITTQVPTIVSNQIEEKVPQMVADEINKPDSPIITELDKKFLPLAGGSLTGSLAMGGNAITNVSDPTNDNDVANKQYVDNALQNVPSQALRHLTNDEFENLSYNDVLNDVDKYAGYLISTGTPQSSVTYIPSIISNQESEYIIMFIVGGDSATSEILFTLNSATQKLSEGSENNIEFLKNYPNTPNYYDCNNKGIRRLADPTNNTDAANKQYVDSKIAQAGGGDFMASGAVPMTGDLNMDNHKIVAVSDPTDSTDGANKHYVDSAITSGIAGAQFLPLSGGRMTGTIDMNVNDIKRAASLSISPLTGGDDVISDLASYSTGINAEEGEIAFTCFKNSDDDKSYVIIGEMKKTGGADLLPVIIRNVNSPIEDIDVANKAYVDSAVTSGIAGAQFLPLTGGTLTGALTLAAAPSEDLQAATKKYVDDATATIATLTSQLATANSEISALKSQVATLNTFMNKFQPMLNTIYNG